MQTRRFYIFSSLPIPEPMCPPSLARSFGRTLFRNVIEIRRRADFYYLYTLKASRAVRCEALAKVAFADCVTPKVRSGGPKAEAAGFEPADPFRGRLLSRKPLSTAQPRLHESFHSLRQESAFFNRFQRQRSLRRNRARDSVISHPRFSIISDAAPPWRGIRSRNIKLRDGTILLTGF